MTPTSGEASRHAVDTSVAVAAGHAAFEVHSVLTRMPGGPAIDAPTAIGLISRAFPVAAWPQPEAAGALLDELGVLGITGGSV